MELFSENKIEKWLQTITRDYCKSHSSNIWLFDDREEYFNFIFGCVGEGIARAIHHKDQWDPESGSFYFFCCLKAYEVLRDEFRKEHRRHKAGSSAVLKDLVLYQPRVADPTRDTEAREIQGRYLEKLSPDQRDVLLLVDYIGCPPKEAASILKRTIDAVYALLKRARRNAAKHYLQQNRSGGASYSSDSSGGSRRPRDKLFSEKKSG